MKIAFIGTGTMGEVMISALLRQKLVSPADIFACDVDEKRLGIVEQAYSIECGPDSRSAIRGRDLVVLSVKPQTAASVAGGLKGEIKEGQLALSIMAGTRIETLRQALRHESIVRAMPNTPAKFGQGMTVWTATRMVSQGQKDMARAVLGAMGKEIYVEDEKYVDMATAVSGSGPAYAFMIMESLIDAGVHIGLPRAIASELVYQTFLGSAHMARESGLHPAQLKNLVTSPGGTTAEGLLRMEDGGVRSALAEAVIAAYEKAQLLGKESSK
ncbi:MAG: pyrroline-5-carboxylate reductase [Dehalococcoidia bacterium]|nr:pyrroline-5-carboxylate reductase [Dehalococcoidia bacterium]